MKNKRVNRKSIPAMAKSAAMTSGVKGPEGAMEPAAASAWHPGCCLPGMVADIRM